jgi:hypothetical protein
LMMLLLLLLVESGETGVLLSVARGAFRYAGRMLSICFKQSSMWPWNINKIRSLKWSRFRT